MTGDDDFDPEAHTLPPEPPRRQPEGDPDATIPPAAGQGAEDVTIPPAAGAGQGAEDVTIPPDAERARATAPTVIEPASDATIPPELIEPGIVLTDSPTVYEPPPSGDAGDVTRVDGGVPGTQRPPSGGIPLGQLPTIFEPDSQPAGDKTHVAPSGSRIAPSLSSGEFGVAGGLVGKYELLREVARGGMGVVYEARQLDLNRVVALKVMLSGGHASAETRRRFRLEAEASARLKHPHIVPVYEIGEVNGNLYFTMDFVEGATLAQRKHELSAGKLLEVMIKVTDGVAYAHQRGIIHRDLKPGNVMMTQDDEPQIMDFGLAKQVELDDDADGHRTVEGSVMGTPHYMPPEQAEGLVSEIDVRADVYALGVILYELFTGQLPFEGGSVSELLMKIFDEDPRPPRAIRPELDPDLEAIVLKCLEKSKEARYDSAAALERDLEALRDGLPVSAQRATALYRARKWARRHRSRLVVAGVFALLIATFGGVMLRQLQAERRRVALEREQAVATANQQAGPLRDEADTLRGRVEQARAAAFDAARVDALRGQAAGLAERVEQARAPVLVYREDPQAIAVAGELAQTGRGVGEVTQALTDMAQVDALLAGAAEGLAELEALAPQVGQQDSEVAGDLATPGDPGDPGDPDDRADRADRADPADPADPAGPDDLDLALAQAACEALLAGDDPGGVAGEDPAFAAFSQQAPAVRRQVFTALGLAGPAAQDRANGLLGRLAELEAQVQRARAQQSDRRVAAQSASRAARLLRAVAATAPPAEDRLRLARLAQGTVERGLEADPELERLRAVRRAANRVYAEALLALKAYLVLNVELEQEDAFDPADRQALRKALARALEQTELLRRELAALAPADDVALALGEIQQRLARLAALKAQGLTPELEALRASVAEQLEAAAQLARRRQALARVAEARTQAQAARAEATTPALLVQRHAAIAAAWERARDLHHELADDLGAGAAAGADACELALAQLEHDAARALERRDPAEALRLARDSLQRYRGLLARGARDVPRSLERALADYVSRLQRVGEKPEGMVLLPGGADLELGSSQADDRNPLREATLRPFYLAELEVTNADYAAFVAAPSYQDPAFWEGLDVDPSQVAPWPEGWGGPVPPTDAAGLPVAGISFDEARGYAAFRGRRLPTDAEWEYAARYRADDTTPPGRTFPWGQAFADGGLDATLRLPGSRPGDLTPAGLADLGGNVSEWVTHQGEPFARGASFLYPLERIARCTFRLHPRAGYRGPQLGLRLAQDAPE